MNKKYYVITNGRTTGIFSDLHYVRMQVYKYRNAKYYVFKNKRKAVQFFFADHSNLQNYFLSPYRFNDELFDLIAYTDGSYNRQKNIFTFGAVMICNRHKIELCEKFNNRKWLKLQNASGEIMGVIKVINFCIQNNLKTVLIYCDYKNLYFWLYTNTYVRNELIKLYRNYVFDMIQEHQLTIAFKWVKSHSEERYNELADFLANEAYELNCFSEVLLKSKIK